MDDAAALRPVPGANTLPSSRAGVARTGLRKVFLEWRFFLLVTTWVKDGQGRKG